MNRIVCQCVALLVLILLTFMPGAVSAHQGTPLLLSGQVKPLQQEQLNRDLFNAVQKEDTSAVETLLRRGANVNARGELRATPLMQAVWSGNAAIVNLLLAHGAAVDARTSGGDTALLIACRENSPLAILQTLLKHGADISAQSRWARGMTPLLSAVATCNLRSTEFLLSQGANIHQGDRDGNTALILTAGFGFFDVGNGTEEERRLAMVKLLLAKGADINETNHIGKTALMAAAHVGYEQVLVFLLEQGARADLKDRYGRTALTWALSLERQQNIIDSIPHELLKYKLRVGVTEALLLGDVTKARALMEQGADVHVLGPENETTLMLAAADGAADIVEQLLNRHISVNAVDSYGTTALLFAVAGRPSGAFPGGQPIWDKGKAEPDRVRIVKLLLAYRAKLKTKVGRNPLTLAKSRGDEDLISILQQAGAKE